MTGLTIYLDSSDYSKLSDPRRATDCEIVRVRQFLLDHAESGAIEIRYSIIHVIEACHRTESSRDLAVARAELIERLSGKRVMRHLVDVIADECTAVRDTERAIALDNDGYWFPRLKGYGKTLSRSLKESLREAVAQVPTNRQQRRCLKRKYGSPTNPRWDAIAQLVGADSTKGIETEYGVSRRFIERRILPRLVERIEDDAYLEREIFDEIFSPIRFVSNYVDTHDENGRIRGSVSSVGSRLVDSTIKFKTDVSAAISQYGREAVERMSRGFRDQSEERQQKLRHAMLAAALRTLDSERQSPFPISKASRASMGLDVLTEAFDHWMLDALTLQSPRSAQDSDAGDLFHMFYLPYVDVWRGDAYSVSLANRLSSSPRAAAVKDLFKLPEVIRDRLA